MNDPHQIVAEARRDIKRMINEGHYKLWPDTNYYVPSDEAIDAIIRSAIVKATAIKDAVIKDDCETDRNVRELARPVLGDFAVDGDSYGVPGLEDIVENLIKSREEITRERT